MKKKLTLDEQNQKCFENEDYFRCRVETEDKLNKISLARETLV